MSQSAVAASVAGGASAPESVTGGGASELGTGASTKRPPPEELQDGDTSNSLEPGEVVTPPHHRHTSSPALKKQMLLGKTLRKTLNSSHNHIEAADDCEEQVRALYELSRKENGLQEAALDAADDSEGLYSDTDSSVEDLKGVQDVQQARKEKQAEAAAAAALPQAPPTPFLGMSPLRFHMRAPPPCFEFPRMGFMPRMARGGPRGMRPPFFGRPPAPNRMGLPGQPPTPGVQLPPGAAGGGGSQGSVGNNPGRCKQPQSDLSWTTLQPPVSFTFNLVSECSNAKHKDCKRKTESASKEPAGDENQKKAAEPSDPLREGAQQNVAARGKTKDRSKERDQNRGKTRERSQERETSRGSPEPGREKSKDRDLTRGKTRERSREKELNRGKTRGASQPRNPTRGKSRDRDPTKGKARERSRARDQARGKTRERSQDQARSKTATERTRVKAREVSQERDQHRGKTRERSKERTATRARTKDTSRSKERERKEKHRARSKEKNEPFNEKSKDKPKEVHDKSMDKSQDKRRERSRENHSEKAKEKHRERSKDKSRRGSRERLHDKSADRVHQTEAKEQKDRSRDKRESTTEPSKDRSAQQSSERRRERSRDKLRERSREKSRHSRYDKSREDPMEEKHLERRSRRAATPHDSLAEASQTQSRTNEGKEGTPPMTPPQQRAQTPPASDTPKTRVYDIFADSPPRPNTAVAAFSAVTIERSTTPPLKTAPTPMLSTKPTRLTPLLKASEIHSRIGALLEDDDNDLHLEALLATKEQLFRRTNEYKERKEAPKEIKAEREDDQQQPRHVNPFNRESVLSSERKSSASPSSKKRTLHRNGSRRSRDSEDKERESESLPGRRSNEIQEITIKIEKDLTPPPPQRTFTVTRIKVERNATPPRERERDREVLVRNGAVAANAPPPPAKEQESPDTDDYIDNWENDDSISSMPKNAAPATPTPAPSSASAPAPAPHLNASLNATPLPPPPAQFNDEDDEEDEDDSNTLWNANSTPPPRAKAASLPMSNIHELYDKFMNSIEMSNEAEEPETSKNSSLSNSTAEESSSGSDSSSSSSSSSDSDEDTSSDDEDEDEEEDGHSSGDESASAASGAAKVHQDPEQPGKEHQQKKNNVSKDLRKLKSLEDNLARIQMMRDGYDAGDEISEELLKMESLFLMQRNAIMEKYRKQELKSSSASEEQQQQQQHQQPMEAPQADLIDEGSLAPVNSIFDANRGAIKMTISRLKLTSKSAIFDKDETEPSKLAAEPPKLSLTLPLPPVKPHKEVAIVKPTIVEARSKPRVLRSPPPPSSATRRRSRSRSLSRNRSKRRSLRSPSPRRWRPPSPRKGSRFAKRSSGGSAPGGATKIGRSHSRSLSRSRTRSRSPNRRRRPPTVVGSRRRGSLSPGPTKAPGPRSPPHSRLRRSLTRERERERDRDRRSRSPLPFKPPSPPMRRSWSHSRSPTRRRSHSRSRSPRFRSPTDGGQSFAEYFDENQGMEAAAYYYNMSLMQQEDQDPTGTGYDTYAAYIDSAYNMEQAYAQFTEGYSHIYGDYPGEMGESAASPQLVGLSVLRELPMAPVVPVAVQKGNVLEIVPTGEAVVVPEVSLMPVAAEEAIEDESKPKRKRVNFVDNVLPNYESESEDRAVVTIAVERALCQYQERRSRAAARLQKVRDELLALPPPPPPLTPKPANLEKPVLVQKKPKFRYFHFDPLKGVIVKTHSRVLRPAIRPPFDPKHFAMLIKTGRLPPFPPGFMRHRPPHIPAHVDPATKAAMLKEFFSKHPPPPLPMPMAMPDGMPYYLSGPPPMAAGASGLSPVPVAVGPQPIPVLGSHGYPGYAQPSPVPVPVPVPPVAVPPPATLAASVPATTAPTPPPALIAPFFTPPPLPELLPILPDLSTQFAVNPVPAITEIMPVDILQQLGPLPKTLDVDDSGGTGSPDDLKEAEAELEAGTEPAADEQPEQPVVEAKPSQLLVETQ